MRSVDTGRTRPTTPVLAAAAAVTLGALLALAGPAAAATGASGAPPADGAPLDQVIGATVAGILLTAGLLFLGIRYRDGRMALLDTLARPFSWLLRVPSWASLPVALATGSLLLAGVGFYWDVAVHIDRGRDPGPFGTPAHFPILIGLFGIFAAGWLAMVMARRDDAARTGLRLAPSWTVPTSGVVMMACGAFALLGFPLDDVWHSIFGQDVTLWGPTHLIMLTGAQLMIPTILGLLCEGRAAVAARSGQAAGRLTRGQRTGRWILAALGAGGVLAGLTIYQAEFGFGVPQYNLLFQPALLALTGGLALIFGRALAGPGGALGAVAFNLLISGVFALAVGPVFGESTPHFPTYIAAGLCVELAALLVSPRRLGAFAVLAGGLVGTVGTLGEAAWTHIWMPIPWPAHFIPSAIAIGVVAALCGALVGAFAAASLAPERWPGRGHRRWFAGALGLAGFAAVLAFCLPTHPPTGATATLTLSARTGGSTRTAEATVVVRPASVLSRPDFVQQLSWQGHTASIEKVLRRTGPGVYRTLEPVPISGSWKSMIRMQQGRMRADVPIYMPADPAIPAAGIPAVTRTTRALVSDTTLMQRERKTGVPGWLWSVATALVLAVIVTLLLIMGWGLNRVGDRVLEGPEPPGPAPEKRHPDTLPAAVGARR
ncbi:MAG: hypothetical protein ACYC91_03540 [Solirubrobacteraceae bacterium]